MNVRRILEDPRELLELHEQEAEELRLREAIIDCLVALLEYRDLEEAGDGDWSIERDFLRHEIGELRKLERKIQRTNRTGLVLDPTSYDREAGDEPAEITDWDLDRLEYLGIIVPREACLVEVLPTETYRRLCFWEGWFAAPGRK